jgi:hypothetical protein
MPIFHPLGIYLSDHPSTKAVSINDGINIAAGSNVFLGRRESL